ncbi:hypothetical protein [Oligoflexus tunisiensis]|uniref:hypothetical protein n=1 Tax=Oligoflexus tunisiensis TaxID=708132 RepID=UPI00114CDE0C|nr:hypothetical protein [Oligoflexus tunisiensis]
MKRTIKRSSLILPLVLTAAACGKSEKTDDAAVTEGPGVTASDASTVSISGQLALNLGLTADEMGVLQFKLMGGSATGEPVAIEVDADGKFSVDIAKTVAAKEAFTEELAKTPAERDNDRLAKALAEYFGVPLAEAEGFLSEHTEEEIQSEIKGFAEEIERTGTMTVLVAYTKTGDKVTEAESFRFIGMPTASGNNLFGMPDQSLIGNANLGSITEGDGDEATSELSSADAFDLPAETQDTLAEAAKALKSLKNAYMNADWRAEPFYLWSFGGEADSLLDAYADISKLTYRGTGFYIGSQTDTPFTFEDICSASPKSIQFVAPTAVNVRQFDGTGVSVTTFANTDAAEAEPQDGKRVCQGGGVGGFYAREDGTHDFMVNFGGGGGIMGAIPSGLWKLSYDGTEVGRFDLAAATPLDADDKPTVFIPSLKFTTSGTKMTGAVVEFYRWNGTEMAKITDMTPLKKLMTETTIGWGNESYRYDATFSEGAATMETTFSEPVEKTSLAHGVFSYKIGQATYRFEFRDFN